MNFDFEISRVDCISNQALETPSPALAFSARKTLSARSIPMPLVKKNKNIFSVYLFDNPINNTRRSSYQRTALISK